jgi:hypothetical protein
MKYLEGTCGKGFCLLPASSFGSAGREIHLAGSWQRVSI